MKNLTQYTTTPKSKSINNYPNIRVIVALFGLAGISITVHAQNILPSKEQINQQEQRQKEQQEQLRSRLKQAEDERSNQLKGFPPKSPTIETPTNTQNSTCFEIKHIAWSNENQRPTFLKMQVDEWLLNNFQGYKCATLVDLQDFQTRLNSSLIDHGFITSKISFPEQNIATGSLAINWYPGVISNISYNTELGKPIGDLNGLFPFQIGALYNQRRADQSIENLKRLNSQANATLDLKPGKHSGTSEIQYNLEPKKFHERIHGAVGIDNSGSKTTGKYQANASLTFDSLLYLHDQLSINYNRNADTYSNQHNTKGLSAQWDVNFGYLNLNTGYSKSGYLLVTPGYNTTLDYEGKSHEFYAGLGYMLYRDSSNKLAGSFKLARKINRNYIEQTEIPIQTRDYVYADMGLLLTHHHQNQQYTLGANIKQSVPSHSKLLGEIYGTPNWDGHWRVITLNATAAIPFKWEQNEFKYNTSIKLQDGQNPLPTSEYLNIGSGYTTRGFDETFGLSSQDGVVWRNELAYLYGKNKAQQIYLGLDYGKVYGPATQELTGTTLIGTALGVRGSWRKGNYDLSLGLPIHKPSSNTTSEPAIYGSLGWSF